MVVLPFRETLNSSIYKKNTVVHASKGYEDDIGTGASNMWMRERELELLNLEKP